MISLTEEQYRRATDNYLGYCLDCGEEASGVEPDAERYKCQICGAMQVFGAEQLLLLGKLEIIEG